MKKLIAIALAVLMLAGLATVAFAENSPTGDVYRKITYTLKFADGKTETLKPEQVEDGKSVVIKAPEKEGYVFESMTISGDYDEAPRAAQEKTYTTSSVTITPHSDIDVVVNYKNASNTNPTDNGKTSPDTGVNYGLVILAAVIGLFGMAVATKKIFVK